MRFEIDKALIEETVFLALRQTPYSDPRRMAFAAEREAAYTLLSLEERERAFADLHARWFAQLKLETPLRAMMDERPLLRETLELFLLQAAFVRKDEGAELFGSKAGGTPRYRAVLRLRPETLLDRPVCERAVRHELLHVSDMLDPEFKYDPHPEFQGATSAQKNLIHDRFTTLWDLRIDARLAREGRAAEASREKHVQRVARVFGDGPWLQALAHKLYDQVALSACACADLLRFAAKPGLLFEWAELDSGVIADSMARVCPSCGFPSCVWAERPQDFPQELRREIAQSIKAWTPDQGLCRQCEEMFITRYGTPAQAG